ncbi:hypothetical protein P4B35_23980 [Pontiellaceae bacterium B12227]|nr:hypothetical protein [Pontiellaceae bacterium B12227]
MDKLIRALWVFFPFYPAIIIWLLQLKFKFDKGYIWIAFCLSLAAGLYSRRGDYFYYSRGGTQGIKIEPEQLTLVAVCLVIMAIWQYVIICKNRKNKTNNRAIE